MPMRLRVILAVVAVAIAGVSVTLVAGLTSAFGTTMQLQAYLGGWSPDGATGDTFWDSPVVDVPGFSVVAIHCHGKMRYDVQVGATGPPHGNPCYAAMGAYSNGSEEFGTYMLLPGGSTAIYRHSVNHGPWTYSIGKVIYGPPPGFGPAPPVPAGP